ncbi:MAG: hypothetical protein HXS44_17030 [Theionarchaea archaeon]|nr:hypothetical protein [Theionarchaea archaeon]
MESLENIYLERNWTPLLWFIAIVLVLTISFVQLEIEEALGIEPHINPGLNFFLGFLTAMSFSHFITSQSRPKIQICNHFLIRHRALEAVGWNQVKKVEKKGNHLILHTPEVQFKKEIRISLSAVKEKEEIVKDVEKICEMKGILFKKE